MKERTKDKIEEIEKYLSELAEIIPEDLNDYIKDFKAKAACERYVERITEAVIDLAFLIIKDKHLPTPENDLRTLDILSKEGFITLNLAGKLQDAKRMRNIIAHEYGEVDDEIVFEAIKEELEKDVKEFLKMIKKII